MCRCEDVTLKDVRHAIELGYRDIEEVKRYTGFGTGPCQGKECHALVATVVAELTGRPPAELTAVHLALAAVAHPHPAPGRRRRSHRRR